MKATIKSSSRISPFERICDKGIITSTKIVEELESRGFNMHGVYRQRFLRTAGVPIVSVYPYGRGNICFVKEEDWNKAKERILGQLKDGMPILREEKSSKNVPANPKWDLEEDSTSVKLEAIEKKLDMVIWAIEELINMEVNRGT